MADDFEFDFSENLDSCFIVADSQEEEHSQLNKSKVMETLSALRATKSNTTHELDEPFSPRRCDLPQSGGQSKSRKTATGGNAGSEDNPQQPGEGPTQGSGGAEGDGSGGGDGGAGGGGDGGGSGGGDNPEEGGAGVEGEEEEEEEDEHAEEGTPSTSGGSSGGSVPPLIAAQVGEHAVPVGVLEHVALQQQHINSAPTNGHHSFQQGGSSSSPPVLEAASPQGGISDAPTAVVTDSDHQGTVSGTPSGVHDHSGSHTSPGEVGLSPRGGFLDISSTHSALSSLTSSSSDPQSTLHAAQRKRPPARRIHGGVQQSKRQKLLDVSSTDTSGRDTSTTSKTDITTTTTDTSHDESRDRSRTEEPPGEGAEDPKGSQEDMFDDKNSSHGPGAGSFSTEHPGAHMAHRGGLIVATPSEKLESLQFSGQAMMVPDTVEDDGSLEEIPPSQGVFNSQTPMLVPSSPTPLAADMPSASQYEDAVEFSIEQPRTLEQSRPKSVHEWQPSFPGFDSSSRSRSASVQDHQGSGAGVRSNFKKGRTLEEPLESQDVQITAVEGTPKKNQQVTKGGDSMALNLHLAESERPSTTLDQSMGESSVILLEPEKTVINLETSSSEEQQAGEHTGQDAELNETSQQLALHLSQSQTQARNTHTSVGFKLSVPTKSNLLTSTVTDKAGREASQGKLPQDGRALTQNRGALFAEEAGVPPQPSLTLDMINTMNDEDSPVSTAFTLLRPTVSPSVEIEESERVSVFTKARDASPRKPMPTRVAVAAVKPVVSAGENSQSKGGKVKEVVIARQSQEADSARLREMIRENQTQEDSQVYNKRRTKKKAKLLMETQENDPMEEGEIQDKTGDSQPENDSTNSSKTKVCDKARFETLLGQATLECEVDNSEPAAQVYGYTGSSGVKGMGDEGGGNTNEPVRAKSSIKSLVGGDETGEGFSEVNVGGFSPGRGARGRGRGGKSWRGSHIQKRGKRGRKSGRSEEKEGGFECQGLVESVVKRGQGRGRSRGRGQPKEEEDDVNLGTNQWKGVSDEGRRPKQSGDSGDSKRNSGKSSTVTGDGAIQDSSSKALAVNVGQGHYEDGNKKKQSQPKCHQSPSPHGTPQLSLDYKILHLLGDTPCSRVAKRSAQKDSSHVKRQTSGLSQRNKKAGEQPSPGKGGSPTDVGGNDGHSADAPADPGQMGESLKTRLVKQPTIKKTRKGKKSATKTPTKTAVSPTAKSVTRSPTHYSPGGVSFSHTDASTTDAISGVSRLPATGVSALEHRTQSVQASSTQRLFHTMTTKTVSCRTVTTVLELVNNKVVATTTTEKVEVLSKKTEHEEDLCTTLSPSRTAQTLTSGDLGDISSFTDSHGGTTHSKSSSSLQTPGLGLTRSHSNTSGSRQSFPSSARSLHKKSLSATTVARGLSEQIADSLASVEKNNMNVGTQQETGLVEPTNEARQSIRQGNGRVGKVVPGMAVPTETSETSDIPLAQVARSVDTLSDASKRTSDEHMVWEMSEVGEHGVKLKRHPSTGAGITKVSSVGKNQRKLSDAGAKDSESLFSTSDGVELHHGNTAIMRKGSVSLKNSESLFSATATSEADTQLLSTNGESVFVRPTTLPLGGKRYSSDSSRRSLGQSTTESEAIPATDVEKVQGRKKVPYIRGAAAEPASESRPVSSGETSDTNVLYFPPYRPTQPVDKDTKVMAMWKDKHYYPGYIQAVTTEKGRQMYLIQFDDGNQRKVKDTELIVCDLLAVGQLCMATTNTETGWSEVCVVVGHHRKGTDASCMVQFEDGRQQRMERSKLCLNHEHAKHLVTASVTLTSVEQATDQGGVNENQVNLENSEQDIIPPTKEQDSEDTSRKQKSKVSKGRGMWRKKKTTAAEDADVSKDIYEGTVAMDSDETEEVYIPDPARMPSTLGLLCSGAAVFAQWRDKCFYPGFIKELDKKSTGRYLVRFEDGDERSVHEEDLVVCEFLPTGMNVLVQKDEGGWSEAALVLGHWRRGDRKGYTVKYEDQTEGKVGRSSVNLSNEQAATFMTEYLRCYSTPRPGLGDLSLENVVGGKRECSSVVSSTTKSKTVAKTTTKKRGPKPKMDTFSSETAAQVTGKLVSVEVLVQDPTEKEEVYIPDPARMPSTLGLLCSDAAVFAQWRDKCFYPGFIKELDKKSTGRYLVRFEDGDERSVHEEDLVVCEFLPTGMNVLVQKDEGGWSEAALVLGHWRRGDRKGYTVKYEDQTEGKVGRSSVNLSEDQAATFLMEYLRPHSTPRPGLGDLSLENVVGGKRERSAPAGSSDKAASSSTKSPAKKRGPHASSGSSQPQSTGGKKRKLIEPKYTSTPTPKRQRGKIQTEEDSAVPSPVGALLDSPIQKKKTPLKGRHELFTSIKGPVPVRGSHIFQGFVFMLTHVDKTEEQKRREKPPELSTTDESLENEGEEVPFDKEHLTKQIEGGGGMVVETFTADHVTTKHCLVISDSHQRTLKYLQAIALGKSCVSHIWIKDCCLTGSLQDWKSYTLPSGFCIEKGCVLEMPAGVRPLCGCRIMVSSENSRFVSTWECIVEAAGARLCHTLPDTKKEALKDPIQAVVSDSFVTEKIVQQAAALDTPMASSEWLIQTIISGRIKAFHGHPKYKYNYEAAVN